MRSTIPTTLVELGRAVELDCDTWLWTWNKKDNYVVCSDVSGKRLFIFKKPPKLNGCSVNPAYTKGKRLFKLFNRRKARDLARGKVSDRTKKTGLGIHIIYNSDKFGPRENYIHEFVTRPTVSVDNPRRPKMIAITGGRIKITARGIEG